MKSAMRLARSVSAFVALLALLIQAVEATRFPVKQGKNRENGPPSARFRCANAVIPPDCAKFLLAGTSAIRGTVTGKDIGLNREGTGGGDAMTGEPAPALEARSKRR